MFTAIESNYNMAADAYVSAVRNKSSSSDIHTARTAWERALKEYEAARDEIFVE
jgi:hypothetical protein